MTEPTFAPENIDDGVIIQITNAELIQTSVNGNYTQYEFTFDIENINKTDNISDQLFISTNGSNLNSIENSNNTFTRSGNTFTLTFSFINSEPISDIDILAYNKELFSTNVEDATILNTDGERLLYVPAGDESGYEYNIYKLGFLPSGDTDSRIYVNNSRIPVVNADVHIRKEGALDVTRYAEVQFPATFEGTRYVDLFQTTKPKTQSSFDTLYIELKDPNGNYVPAFRGFVTGVGATDNVGVWQCRARGPADLLNSVTAGKQFTNSPIDAPLTYVSDELEDKAPFPVDVVLDTEATEGVGVQQGSSGGNRSLAARLNAQDVDYDVELSNKTFQKNRHTLKDVVDWLRSKSSLRLWFEPTTDGVTLVSFDAPTANSFSAHYLGGDVEVISNNALSELAPINTIEARGSARRSLEEVFDFDLNFGGNKFVVAKARHKALYKRAGNTELQADTFIKSDGTSKKEVKDDAKSALKDAIDEATAGDMMTLLAGGITPFDTIEARPTCRTEAEKTVPITYEVNRVHHMVSPDDEDSGNISKSRLNVGIHTDIQDDIEIKPKWVTTKSKES